MRGMDCGLTIAQRFREKLKEIAGLSCQRRVRVKGENRFRCNGMVFTSSWSNAGTLSIDIRQAGLKVASCAEITPPGLPICWVNSQLVLGSDTSDSLPV